MYVSFPISVREFTPSQRDGRSVSAESPAISAIKVSVFFSDGGTYKHQGKITFINVTVDRGTDLLTAICALD